MAIGPMAKPVLDTGWPAALHAVREAAMRGFIKMCGGVFVVLGAVVIGLAALLAMMAAASGSGASGAGGLLVVAAGGLSGATICMVGGASWMLASIDERLEQIAALARIRAAVAGGPPIELATAAPANDEGVAELRQSVREASPGRRGFDLAMVNPLWLVIGGAALIGIILLAIVVAKPAGQGASETNVPASSFTPGG